MDKTGTGLGETGVYAVKKKNLGLGKMLIRRRYEGLSY